MNAFPPVGSVRTRLEGLSGQPPDLRQLPEGCAFAARCPKVIAGTCDVIAPPEVSSGEGRRVACHLYGHAAPGVSQGGRLERLGYGLEPPAEGGLEGKVSAGG